MGWLAPPRSRPGAAGPFGPPARGQGRPPVRSCCRWLAAPGCGGRPLCANTSGWCKRRRHRAVVASGKCLRQARRCGRLSALARISDAGRSKYTRRNIPPAIPPSRKVSRIHQGDVIRRYVVTCDTPRLGLLPGIEHDMCKVPSVALFGLNTRN